jgi:hypothetical protein
MDAAMQHATWMAQAREHLKEHRPQTFARLQAAGTLEQHLKMMAETTSSEIRNLMAQGAAWQEAWEQARGNLFPEPEPQTTPKMPQREGFRAHRELTRDLGTLTMPGEKDQPQ